MNSKQIPLIFLIVILTVSAVALPSAFAGVGGWPPSGSPPLKTTFTPSHGSEGGVPIVYYGAPFEVSVDVSGQCIGKGGVVAVTLGLGPFDDGTEFGGEEFAATLLPAAYADGAQEFYVMNPASGAVPDTSFKVTVPALNPSHGLGAISYTITCGNGEGEFLEDGSVYVDPSGQIFNECTGQPIQGATVTLLRDEGGFVIPNPIAHVPATNPQLSAADGSYGWMVEPFFDYKVTVSFPGFVSQESVVLSIPPEVTGLDFYLVPVDGCPKIIGGNIIPVESTALLVAGAQSTTWMIPLVLSILGIGLFVVTRKQESS